MNSLNLFKIFIQSCICNKTEGNASAEAFSNIQCGTIFLLHNLAGEKRYIFTSKFKLMKCYRLSMSLIQQR